MAYFCNLQKHAILLVYCWGAFWGREKKLHGGVLKLSVLAFMVNPPVFCSSLFAYSSCCKKVS